MTRGFVRLRRIAVISGALCVLASAVASGQTTAPASPCGQTTETTLLSSPAFARQVLRKNVWLTTSDCVRRKGRVKALTPAGMTVAGLTDGPVPLDRIVRVEKVTHRVRNGAIVGFVVAFLPGLAAVSAGYCEDVGCSGGGQVAGLASLYGLIGAATGAAIGGALNAHKRERDILYDARRRTTTVSLAPILSPTRKGLAFSMTWR